jgi:hypothetical protein
MREVVVLSSARTLTAVRPENLDAVARSVVARVLWWQVRALWGRVSLLLGAVVMVYGLEKMLGRAGGVLGRVVVVLALLVLGLRVARGKMGLRLASLSSILNAERGSAESWVREQDERSLLRLRCLAARTVEREGLLLVRLRLSPSWKLVDVSKYPVASSPRPPTYNTSRRRRGHRDYY